MYYTGLFHADTTSNFLYRKLEIKIARLCIATHLLYRKLDHLAVLVLQPAFSIWLRLSYSHDYTQVYTLYIASGEAATGITMARLN